MDAQGFIAAEPVAVLHRKLGGKWHKVVVYVSIQCSNTPKEEATWELYIDIENKFPRFPVEV